MNMGINNNPINDFSCKKWANISYMNQNVIQVTFRRPKPPMGLVFCVASRVTRLTYTCQESERNSFSQLRSGSCFLSVRHSQKARSWTSVHLSTMLHHCVFFSVHLSPLWKSRIATTLQFGMSEPNHRCETRKTFRTRIRQNQCRLLHGTKGLVNFENQTNSDILSGSELKPAFEP